MCSPACSHYRGKWWTRAVCVYWERLTHPLGQPSFVVRSDSSDQACYILGVKTWLSTLQTVSLVERGSSVVGSPLRNLGKFIYSTYIYDIACVFRMSHRKLVPSTWCVCQPQCQPARGSKISHTVGNCATCLWTPHYSVEKDNSLNHSCVSLKMGCLELETKNWNTSKDVWDPHTKQANRCVHGKLNVYHSWTVSCASTKIVSMKTHWEATFQMCSCYTINKLTVSSLSLPVTKLSKLKRILLEMYNFFINTSLTTTHYNLRMTYYVQSYKISLYSNFKQQLC